MTTQRTSSSGSTLKGIVVEVIDLIDDDELSQNALKEELVADDLVHVEEGVDESSEDEDSGGEYWESDSLIEDALAGLGSGPENDPTIDACTPAESRAFVARLREVGDEQFITETVEAGTITAKKLLTAFGVRPPPFLEGSHDDAYCPLLGYAIQRELRKRAKLPQFNTIDDAVRLLQTSRNIIVLTGAGISTSLGIPDFRSKGTGLYSKLKHLGLSDPQEVFDINMFREDPSIFYSVAKDILPSTRRYTPTHAFIRLLQDKGKLLTNYTQNIDNLEGHAGILPEKLIQCHGSFGTATCQTCAHKVNGDEIFADIKAGRIPKCKLCSRRSKICLQRPGMKRKRSSNRNNSRTHSKSSRKREEYEDSTDDEDDDNNFPGTTPTDGVMKPDITFFGEDLPEKFHDRITKHDKDVVDLVIVIGTSLKVAPVSEVVPFLDADVPQLYVSREACAHVNFDIDLFGDCDVVVAELCRRAGWGLEHEMIPKGQIVHADLEEGYESRWRFTEHRREAEISLKDEPDQRKGRG
ncbi:NAD-dependent histone deacetylase sir2 [Agyrium rufum]|nr:NAD-dependent histone deacetylase sir2 [Agyrium rufum]